MKKMLVLTVAALSLLALAGCQASDVVGKVSVTSFEALLQKAPAEATEGYTGWELKSPGGEAFLWSSDFSAADQPDLMLQFDGTPFIDAGLDPGKLDKETYGYDAATGLLSVRSELGPEAFTYSGEKTPLEAFRKLVETHRDSIGYHEALDHYGAALGNGNAFEWAKDMTVNDKDMVFVLNPEPLIAAGVSPTQVEGWAFAQVEVKDADGKPTLTDKFLKPYSLD